MIGQGVSSRSSHSAAAGRTTFSAKPWTHSWMSFWSWLSSSENSAVEVSGAAVASVMVNESVTVVYTRRRDAARSRQSAYTPGARHRLRDALPLRGAQRRGGVDRRRGARGRHQQGAHLPPRRLQG